MRKSRKITRNSYKRKVVLFGVLVFLSIALISTGFASWVMSQGAKQESNGNVSVGVVADSNLKFEKFELSTSVWNFYENKETIDPEDGEWKYETKQLALNEYSFNFEPIATDDTGRVRVDGKNVEALHLVVNAIISPEEFIDTVSISLTIPQGIKAAADAGYIILPECAVLDGEEAVINIKVGGETAAGTFKSEVNDAGQPTGRAELNYRIEFLWGEKFNFLNPGLYFDTDVNGMEVSDDDAKKELETFRAMVYGYSYDEFQTLKAKALAAAEQPDNEEIQLTEEEAAKYADMLNPKTPTEDNPNPYVKALTYKLTITANIN